MHRVTQGGQGKYNSNLRVTLSLAFLLLNVANGNMALYLRCITQGAKVSRLSDIYEGVLLLSLTFWQNKHCQCIYCFRVHLHYGKNCSKLVRFKAQEINFAFLKTHSLEQLSPLFTHHSNDKYAQSRASTGLLPSLIILGL